MSIVSDAFELIDALNADGTVGHWTILDKDEMWMIRVHTAWGAKLTSFVKKVEDDGYVPVGDPDPTTDLYEGVSLMKTRVDTRAAQRVAAREEAERLAHCRPEILEAYVKQERAKKTVDD
jgi:hypothetical protein